MGKPSQNYGVPPKYGVTQCYLQPDISGENTGANMFRILDKRSLYYSVGVPKIRHQLVGLVIKLKAT